MKRRVSAIAALLSLATWTHAVTPTAGEIAQAHDWAQRHFATRDAAPFSFSLGQRVDATALAGWDGQAERRPDGTRIRHRVQWLDRKTGLSVRCDAVEYSDFPAVEWIVHLKNTGPTDTPVVEGLTAIDWVIPVKGQDVTLHRNAGSPYSPTDYRPIVELLTAEPKRVSAAGGRSTNTDLPFFNLHGGTGGVIVASGWPGQWSAELSRHADGARVVAGQELTRFVLHPGEEVRTPLVAMLFYDGDVHRGQNLWRRWMLRHNLPRTSNGEHPGPMTAACSSHQFSEMIHADEASQKLFVDRYLEEGIKLDYWWMDAGWYVNNGNWPNTGTWEVDRKRFPNGLRAVSDHANSKGVKTLVWFEPERVNPGTWLYDKHPEWLLGKDGGDKLLNLGNDAARTWWTDHADKLLTEQGIHLYRTDFNIDPLAYWRSNDTPDRQGITENKYVVGLLAYLDDLRQRHPDMLIDTCASGGRRNDLEMLRRAVPLLRSDFILEPVSQQNHTYGISGWIPYWGTGINSADPYVYRSQMGPWQTNCFDVRNRDLDYASIRKLWTQWRDLSPTFLSDYYPLTPYDPAPTAWMAWQYNDPEGGRGVIQAFRRPESKEQVLRIKLKGLDTNATYEIHDLDRDSNQTMTGRDLMVEGFNISRDQTPAAVVLTYRRRPA